MGKNKTKERKLQVAASAPLFYELSQEQKRPEFQKKYKKRAAQEWKNAEMNRFHGMARARGWGLRSIRLQVKFTAIAVNLKRIAALIASKTPKTGGDSYSNRTNLLFQIPSLWLLPQNMLKNLHATIILP